VANLLADLERYIHNEDSLPPLLRVAAIQVQFETIHPYLDGNGRLGRMLIALLLEHWRLLSKPLLYMSAYLKKHQANYYRHLEQVRTDGDWLGWFRFFLAGTESVARDAVESARQLHRQVIATNLTLLCSSEGVREPQASGRN
jgi:Fic family protein